MIMADRRVCTPVLLTLLALTVVYAVGTTFLKVLHYPAGEVDRANDHTSNRGQPGVEAMNRENIPGTDGFTTSMHVRLVGYARFARVVLLAPCDPAKGNPVSRGSLA